MSTSAEIQSSPFHSRLEPCPSHSHTHLGKRESRVQRTVAIEASAMRRLLACMCHFLSAPNPELLRASILGRQRAL